MNSPPKDPREAKPGLPDDVARFLLKAIARDPNDRFQTAHEMRDVLRRLAGK